MANARSLQAISEEILKENSKIDDLIHQKAAIEKMLEAEKVKVEALGAELFQATRDNMLKPERLEELNANRTGDG